MGCEFNIYKKNDKAESWTLNFVNSALITDISTLPLHYRPIVKFTYRWVSSLAMSAGPLLYIPAPINGPSDWLIGPGIYTAITVSEVSI